MVRRALVVGAVAALATVIVSGGFAANRDAFAGLWVGQELAPPAGDGSTDFMAIGLPKQDGTQSWLYYETNASGYCAAGGGGPLTAFGTGTANGTVLTVTVRTAVCANGAAGSFPTPFDLPVTSVDGDHVEFSGVAMSRIGSSVPHALPMHASARALRGTTR